MTLSLFVASVAGADPTRPEDVLAQSLFDDATALMNEGKFEQACPKLAESQRLGPGGGTLLNLAFCLEKLHRYASAYTAYNEALSASIKDGRKDRESAARERIAAVMPLLSRVSVRVPPRSARLAELEVRFDGTPVREAAWGVAAPVDPGTHEVSATAKGKRPWSAVVQIDADGTSKEVVVGPFEDAFEPVVAAAEPAPSGLGGQRTAAIAVGAGAGVALVTGVITGALALSAHDERNAKCASGCTPAAYAAEDRANALAWAANITIGAAIVGGVVAAVLFFTAKSPAPPRSAGLFWTGARAGIEGTFW